MPNFANMMNWFHQASTLSAGRDVNCQLIALGTNIDFSRSH